jgi:hypothetical protein
MKPKTSPQEHINKLNEFRQAIYAHGLKKRRDAQFELIDALLMQAKVGAFPELTLSPVFRRQWSSAYKAIGTGTQDRTWLTRYLSQQVPEAGSSWALPVDSRRVTAAADAVMTGMQQIDALLDARRDAGLAGLIVIATDGKYSNQACNRACAKRGGIAKAGRMRCDRRTALVDIAYWQLFLMRDWVQDCPLPWQAPQVNPTPERVLQSLGAHFTQLGTPAKPPMTRGKSPGWPKGRPRDPPKRYQPVKRSQKTA